ncbi:MAG: hypothetical protein ACRENI_05485 [Gemmatimonadaceae bacterium]
MRRDAPDDPVNWTDTLRYEVLRYDARGKVLLAADSVNNSEDVTTHTWLYTGLGHVRESRSTSETDGGNSLVRYEQTTHSALGDILTRYLEAVSTGQARAGRSR